MKRLSLLCATLAFPASIALAQTPPAPGTTDDQLPYIPLFGTTGGTNGSTTNSAWFVDTVRNQVVLCATGAAASGNGPQSFTCSAQPVPGTTPAPAPGATAPGAPASGGGATGAGGGAAGANPMGGS